MKPSLNNNWGRALSNRIRSYLNLPPVSDQDDGMLNTVIGDDKYLLALEAAAVEDVALLSLFKKVTPFSVGRHLEMLLEQVSISKHLPAPVHVALKSPDSLVIMTRIPKQTSDQAIRFLDLLFSIYEDAEKRL